MIKAMLAVLLLLAAGQARAVDAVFTEAGAGNSVYMARIGMVWNWNRGWAVGDRWRLGGAWEVEMGGLLGEKPAQNDQILADAGITPVFRMVRTDDPGAPYLEGGIAGLHLFSRAFIYEGKKFGSAFQFGHFWGVGRNFGNRRQYSLSYRFEHMSNGGIVQPNQGVNLSELHIAYFF